MNVVCAFVCGVCFYMDMLALTLSISCGSYSWGRWSASASPSLWAFGASRVGQLEL